MSFDRTGLKKGDSWLKDIHVRFYRVDKFSFPGLAVGDGGGGEPRSALCLKCEESSILSVVGGSVEVF